MFEHLCKEKDGAVWRGVRLVQPSIDWANSMIEKMHDVPNFLSKSNPYTELFDHRNLFFQVDEVGLIAVINLPQYDRLRHVHVTFWDGRLRGREGLCKTLATWVVNLSNVILFTQIPEDRKALLAFAERVGFVQNTTVGSSRTLVFSNYTG